jgi:uncharacterized membrane protein
MRGLWFIVARALHVLAVVVWIGGVAAVTTVVLPTMRRLDSNEQKLWLFEQVESRFRPQARLAWLVVGLTGLYMLYALGAWGRFIDARYWWMHAMVALWVVFGLMLFIVEPLVVGPRLQRKLKSEPGKAVARIEKLHWLLLVLSLCVISAAVAGAYGWLG